MSVAIITGCLAIGVVATMLGVSTRTLRRWDKAGTMKPAFRTAGNHRRYDRRAVLDTIQHGAAGNSRPSRAGHEAGRPASSLGTCGGAAIETSHRAK